MTLQTQKDGTNWGKREREKEREVVALHVEVVAMVASGVFYNA